jgi:hypothetical protein
LEATSSKKYDEYIAMVFEIVLQEKLTNDMQEILKLVIHNECIDISDTLARHLQEQIVQSQLHGAPHKCPQAEEFGKPSKVNGRQIAEHHNPQSPRREDQNKKHSSQSSKPNSVFGLRKEKPICKNRTLYFQRKVLHVPRGKEWTEQMHCLSEHPTMPLLEDKESKMDDKPQPLT